MTALAFVRRTDGVSGEGATMPGITLDIVAPVADACCEGVRPPALSAEAAKDLLTSREREVSTLAARGLSNREIATRLFISLRTVENHLHRAFAKLGVTRREQLPGALGEK
jgi:DNA-binding NarL/FixJ family response regulator